MTNTLTTERRELPPLSRMCGKELTAEENINREIRFDRNKLEQVATILSSRGHNNAAVIGPAGTGKTALVSALAAGIAEGRYKTLTGRRVVEVDIDKLLNNVYTTAERGTKLANLLQEAEREGIILFFDEGHRLYGGGEANSLGNIMKPFLTRDGLQVIIATTIDEYNAFIARDPAFRRRFEAVVHKEPDAEETMGILKHVLRRRYPDVTADDEVLQELVDLGGRYILDRNNPDKSLALLDTAVAWARNHRDDDKDKGCDGGRDGNNSRTVTVLTKELVCEVISNRLGVPRSSLSSGMAEGLDGMSGYLEARFPGWNAVCADITESLNRARTRKLRRDGPLASVILCGPDARFMNDISHAAAKKLGCAGDGAIFRIDVNKADPEDPYTVYVRRNPNAALIFSGINENTDPAVISRLREILCSGKLKNAAGQTADYSHACVFFLCEDELRGGGQIGFIQGGKGEYRISETAEYLVEALGADRHSVITAGAPDAAYIPKLFEKIFLPLLAASAKRCGCESRIILSETGKSKVKEILATQTAWSGMHEAVEEIVLTAVTETEPKEEIIVEYEDESA